VPKVIFISPDGTAREYAARVGETLLDVVWNNDIDIEGACEGMMACSTCHVIVDAAFFPLIPAPGEEEADMLELAYGLTPTSRLGCQIVMTDALDGLKVTLPDETHNLLGG
jgi:2Fe-2S ferredoxin